MRLLIVEDEVRLASALQRGLIGEGFTVDVAHTGPDGLHAAQESAYDALILDIMLPGLSGYRIIERLRAAQNWVPILMLTAKDGEYDEADALDLGADDYLTKPFDLPELEARVRALIRRGQSGGSSVLTHGPLVLDTSGRRATLGGAPLELSAREIGVLEILMLRSGRVVSKEQLAGQLYGWDEEVGANAIEVYVHRLRKKVEAAGVTIRTIRGLGYLLEKDG